MSSLIDELFNTVGVLGVKQTAELLKNSRNQNLTLQDERVDFILKTISQNYNLEVQHIFYSSERGHRLFALMFILYYMRECFYFSYKVISYLLNKSHSYCFKKHQEMKEIKKNKKHEFQKKFEKLDLLITQYQLKNK